MTIAFLAVQGECLGAVGNNCANDVVLRQRSEPWPICGRGYALQQPSHCCQCAGPRTHAAVNGEVFARKLLSRARDPCSLGRIGLEILDRAEYVICGRARLCLEHHTAEGEQLLEAARSASAVKIQQVLVLRMICEWSWCGVAVGYPSRVGFFLGAKLHDVVFFTSIRQSRTLRVQHVFIVIGGIFFCPRGAMEADIERLRVVLRELPIILARTFGQHSSVKITQWRRPLGRDWAALRVRAEGDGFTTEERWKPSSGVAQVVNHRIVAAWNK
eukprot:6938368-Prymnesium_polylepis.1